MSLLSESLLLDFFGIITALIVIVHFHLKWKFCYWKRKRVNHMAPTSWLGTYDKHKSLPENMRMYYDYGKKMKWKHFGIYTAWHPVLVVTDLELVKNVLLTDFDSFTDRGVYFNEKNPVDNILFFVKGKAWKSLRKKSTPLYSSAKLRHMFQSTSVKYGVVLGRAIENQVKSEPVNVKELVEKFTTSTIGSCIFGWKCNSFKEEFYQYCMEIFSSDSSRVLPIKIASIWPGLAKLMNMSLTSDYLGNIFSNMVKDMVKYRKENNVYVKDILQHLIDNNEPTDDIISQTFVVLLAGFETISSAIIYAMLELSQNIDIQEKARQEILEVLARHKDEITFECVSEMKYLEQILNEAIRKYPFISSLTRVCVKNYKIPNSDVTIEKGTYVLIPVDGFHYDEDYFPNPEKFEPNRFSDKNKNNIQPFSYMGFGGGQRYCVGERFGIVQGKVALIALLEKHKYTMNEKTELPLKLTKGLPVNILLSKVWLNCEKIK